MIFLILLFLKTMVLFLAAANAKRINDAGGLTLFWKCICYPLAAVFMVYDVTFNIVLGSLMYLELPKLTAGEWTFSARTRRHYDSSAFSTPSSWRARVASWWADQIDIFLPGHI